MIAAVGEYPLLVQLVLLANDIVNFTCELTQCDTDYDTNCDTMPDSRDVIVFRLSVVLSSLKAACKLAGGKKLLPGILTRKTLFLSRQVWKTMQHRDLNSLLLCKKKKITCVLNHVSSITPSRYRYQFNHYSRDQSHWNT